MNQPKPKIVDPAIDDMLTSIRDAIHQETAREAEEHARTFKTRPKPGSLEPEARHPSAAAPPAAADSRGSSVSGSMRELRVSLQPAGQAHSRGTVTARSQDFLSLKNKLASLRQPQSAVSRGGNMASIMGGDAQLDDAIDRMAAAEELQRQSTTLPPRADTVATPQSNDEVPIRGAALDDLPGEPSEISYSSLGAAPEDPLIAQDPAYEDFAAFEHEPAAPEFTAATPDPAPVQPDLAGSAEPVRVQADVEQAPPSSVHHASVDREQVETATVQSAPIESPPAEPMQLHRQFHPHPPNQSEQVSMLSGDAMRAAGSAFDRLSDELFSRTSGGAQVLEDSARDMIKPMLKDWLDDNLPALVERLVREEIERVVRKGGR